MLIGPSGVTSADKYTVQFDEGDEVEFYDIQLVRAAEEMKKGAERAKASLVPKKRGSR